MTDKYAPPFSLRLTEQERIVLDRLAGTKPIGTYIRSQLFLTPSPRKRNFRRPVKDEQSLSRLLTELGRARLANNLNQLAKASNSGSLPVTPETEKALIEACEGIQYIREQLVKALGLRY